VEYTPFRMERWQSTYEHRVRFNLSESGVHPLTPGELAELAGRDVDLSRVRLGYGQSNGSDELRARIADLYPGATDRSILVTTGGAEANFVAAWELLEPGTPAAVLVPNYMQVPGLLRSFRAPVRTVPLREEEGWQPDPDEVERAFADGARFLLVTHPNNPTGAALTAEAIEAIVEAAERHGAWILADEVYQGAEASGETTPSFWGRSPRVLVTNSLSKAYGLPGLRLGWLVGPEERIAGLWGRTDYTTIAPGSLSDALARIALEPGTRARILDRTRGIVRRNRGVLADWVERRGELFTYRPPDAGAICYLRYRAPVSSTELAETLRREQDVLVVPGDHFEMDRYLRIGFGPPEEELRAALERVGEAFDEIRAAASA